MKYLNWKPGVAALTFIIGTTLVIAWLAFGPKIIKSLESSWLESPAVESPPLTSTDAAYLEGRRNAERDVKGGKLVIMVKGQTLFEVILREELDRYGVQIKSIGCFYEEQDVERARGYNEVSRAAIDARFGKGVVEEAIRKAAERDSNYAP